jgi:uncharacterized membrane protein YfhO
MEKDGPLYAYYWDGYDIQIYVNGTFLKDHLNAYGNGIVPLGYYQAGEQVEIRIEGGCTGVYYYQDMEVFEEQIQALSKQEFYIYNFSQDSIEGECYSDGEKEYLVFSIPYEEAWTVKVDGEEVETSDAYGALLAVKLPEGTHQITLRYVTSGFLPGAAVSGGCLGLWAVVGLVCFLKGRTRRYEISSVPL